jgi:nicotinic acid mononucleotide adenylyltransferase
MVYPREGSYLSENNLPNIEILQGAPLFPISSTQIREKIAAGASLEDFLL